MGINLEPSVKTDDDTIQNMPDELRNTEGLEEYIRNIKDFPIRSLIHQWHTLEQLNFERYFIRMYGTQIGALNFLSSKSEDEWEKIENIKSVWYSLYVLKAGANDYEFRSYVNYMIEPFYLLTKIEANVEYVKITPRGRRFIIYIKTNYPDVWMKKDL